MTIGTQLVGREGELASLVALLDAQGASVGVVAGEAGIGKTALWLAALDEARRRGDAVLTCRPSEVEARYSFSGLADLLDGRLDEVLPELPPPQREALQAALGVTEAGATVEERLVAYALLGAVRRLAAARPLVLAVDDLQWLDPPSSALLRYVLPRLAEEDVAVLLTTRGAAPPWLARLAGLVELDLRPLSVGALHELLRARLGAQLPRPVLLRVWETSGGNPFYALELARALQRRGGTIEPGGRLPVPETLEELVLERLEALDREAHEACRVVAAAAEPTVELVERVLGAEPGGVEAALRARVLELDGERLRFSHPLLASAVAERTVGERRRALHARLAELVSDPEEQARHLAAAAPGPSEEIAAALEAAADRARSRGSPRSAAELAERAVALTPAQDGPARLRRRLAAADLHFETGDVEQALATLEGSADEAPPGPARAAVLLRLARIRAERSGAVEAVALWREALAQGAGDERLVARIRLELGQFLRFTEGTEPALVELEGAVAAAERVGDDELCARALGAYTLVHFNSGRGVDQERVDRALALERRLGGGESMISAGFVAHQLVWTGDVDRARELIGRLDAWARAHERPEATDAAWYLALLEWRHGDWAAAAEAAARAVALAEQFGREAGTITAFPAAVIAAHLGDTGQAAALVERGLAAHAVPAVARAGFEWVLGFISLSGGDPAGAVEPLERAASISDALGIREPALRWFMPDLLDALLGSGDAERAAETVAPYGALARELDRPWAVAVAARTEALLRAVGGDLDGALAGLEEALAEHERALDRFQRARTLLALGITQRRAKQRGAARRTLERAQAEFAALPAPLWAEQAGRELGRIGGRAPSRGDLTESEARIAALVAEGRSNRDVAAALFLTEHSVETALTRIYRKLGVRSRAALAHRISSNS